jgi:hypothetical protein
MLQCFRFLNGVPPEDEALSIETCWGLCKKLEYWILVCVQVGCFVHVILYKYVHGMDNIKFCFCCSKYFNLYFQHSFNRHLC